MNNIDLRLGNALEELDNIEVESIDLGIIDPPYKLNKTTGGVSKTGFVDKWQGNIRCADKTVGFENTVMFKDWLPKVYRVLKPNSHCYIFTNDKNLCELEQAAEQAGFRLHNILVWKKNNLTPNRWYMKNCEFVLFLYKGKAKSIYNKGTSQCLEFKNITGKEKLHPVEKPVDLLKVFVENSSQKGDVILDCFMGVGSTGVASVELGRKFIGVEIDEKYFKIAFERLNNLGDRM